MNVIGGARCENQGTHEIGDADRHGSRFDEPFG
jgi:hypothetical protein